MINKLIKALEIRKKQLLIAQGKTPAYHLYEGHHLRDVITTLAVLKKAKTARALLKTMPTEQDLPK